MPRSGDATRLSILEAAEMLIYRHGYAGASIERIIAEVGITKGAFFHHFKSKSEMATALVRRYADDDVGILNDVCTRASNLSDDPVQRLLIIIGLLAEETDNAPIDNPMCFFAAYAYQRAEFPEHIGITVAQSISDWYDVLRPYYQSALEARPPKREITANELISFLTGIFEGGFVLAAIHLNPAITGQHLRMHRTQLELLFDL